MWRYLLPSVVKGFHCHCLLSCASKIPERGPSRCTQHQPTPLPGAHHTCASVAHTCLREPRLSLSVGTLPLDSLALYPCRGKAVCAALLRIFGRHLAEVPLVATRTAARRQGHCRVLMTAIERMLQTLNVGVLSLPAAQTAISTWVNAFEFRPMQALELQAVQSELRVLTFPGSQVSDDAEPGGGWAGRQREG